MQPQYINNEDYQFPLPVQDMNNEIISRLDDESLYQLCQTNRQMARTCLSNNIWTLRANSPLAPLYIVRDQYKNWMDFYANVRKDYLYYVGVRKDYSYRAGEHGIHTDIKFAFLSLLRYTKSLSRSARLEQLELAAARPTLPGRHGSIKLVRKDVVYDRKNVGEFTLYSIGTGDDFLNPAILTFPDLVNMPVMKLVTKSEDMENVRYVNFSAQALAKLRLIPNIIELNLFFNNTVIGLISMRPFGWILANAHDSMYPIEKIENIIDGAALNIEGISTDKYHIVSLPPQVIYQGTTFNFLNLVDEAVKGISEGINNLRWYIATFGTFYKIEDIEAFLQKYVPDMY